jgi:hypothetical protein
LQRLKWEFFGMPASGKRAEMSGIQAEFDLLGAMPQMGVIPELQQETGS